MTNADTPEERPIDDQSTPTETIESTPSTGRARDWMLPAALIGGLLLLVVVFAAGFLVGRATECPTMGGDGKRAVVEWDHGHDRLGHQFGASGSGEQHHR